MKKRILSIALVVAMLAIAITGGTLAYLNDVDGAKNVMVAGNVIIEQNEVFVQNSKLIPAVINADSSIDNKVQKDVTVTNNGTESAFVRTIFLSEAAGDGLIHMVPADGVTLTKYDFTVTYDNQQFAVYSYTYEDALAAKATAGSSLKEIYLDKDADNQWYTDVNVNYDLYVFSQAVQSAGFDGPAEGADYALNEAFGDITKTNVEDWLTNVDLFA